MEIKYWCYAPSAISHIYDIPTVTNATVYKSLHLHIVLYSTSYVSLEHYKALQEGMKCYNIKENKQTRNPPGSDTSRKALV